MLELNTLKSENINWLEVVLDYGKRNPEVRFKHLGLGGYDKFSELRYSTSTSLGISYLCTNNGWYKFRIVQNKLQYYDVLDWRFVPKLILLRLLTEGKEDLI